MATAKEKPPKWTRAKAPRVRTGCVTCKIRHLKCDEEKPQCRRCIKDGHVCDGYEVISGRKPKSKAKDSKAKESPPSTAQLVLRHKHPVVQVSLPPTLIFDASQLPTEMDLFHHVRTCTIQDLASALTPTDFWYIHALPLGHAVEPIKYAICALGGAHKHFKSQLLGESGNSTLQALEEMSIQQYNQAIRHIQSFTQTPSKKNMEVILTCCVIFICVENLLGRYSESFRHMQAGCALLASIRQLSDQEAALSQQNGVQMDKARDKSRFFDDIGALLSRLGQDAAMYMGVDIIPELYVHSAPTIDFPRNSTPFDSVSTAAQTLFAIETEHGVRMHIAELEWKNSPEYDGRDLPPYWDDDSLLPENDVFNILDLENIYHDWSVRFDLFKSQIDKRTVPKQELRQISMLSIGQSMWSTFLEMKSFDDEISREAADTILKRVESLIEIELYGQDPIFSFDANVVPAITLVFTSCNDFEVQWRCVRLLRSIRIREGIWDSKEMGDILESTVMARERGLITFQALPWKVPQLARLVSSLRLTQSRISTGALALAEEDADFFGTG